MEKPRLTWGEAECVKPTQRLEDQPARLDVGLLIPPINEMHLVLIIFILFYGPGGDARTVHSKKKKILKSLQNDRRVKTIVGPTWFLPQQRHLSAKVS